MAARQTKQEKQLDRQIEAAYYRHAEGVQINIFDIPKVFREAEIGVAAGADLDIIMIGIVKRYRVN